MLSLTPVVSSQPSLSVSPDTLRYPTEVEITLRNTSSVPLRIDSFGITPSTGYAWAIRIDSIDANNDLILNSAINPVEPLNAVIEADSSLRLYIIGYDPCIFCKAGIIADDLEIVDTLFVYTSDPAGITTPALHKVYLDISTLVSNEELPAAQANVSVEVYPNPAQDHLILVVSTRAAATRVEAYDALGRLMMQQQIAGTSGPQHVALDVSAWPAGIYFVRLVAEGGESRAHPFVVQR